MKLVKCILIDSGLTIGKTYEVISYEEHWVVIIKLLFTE
jgi:hypothetical protein